jgi:photolyase PhrII
MNPADLLHRLPLHLRERTHILTDRGDGGNLVVCWIHHASRIDENPLLDVAAEAARVLRLPLVVHAGFGGRHPHSNDRHTCFMLEGFRALQIGLAASGIRMSITPPPAPGSPSGLRQLASKARLLLAEDQPVRPYPRWTEKIAEQVPGAVILVDTACIAPARMIKGVHDRAFRFRAAAEPAWRARLDLDWPAASLEAPEARPNDLPTGTIDLQSTDLRELIGQWDLDHTVGPIPDLPGGAAAAEEGWRRFRTEGLARYHQRRNDATLEGGVSGLSPYLHHGMISPMRIAREAHRDGGKGATKFLDELLVWRELALHFCLHHPRHDSLDALPEWARRTLERHRRDDRPGRRSWETLARGRTGDRVWDLAQASLRTRGRLHNNLRMTWGKMLLEWTASPEEALDRLFDLNDRYALDGSDANSIGGLLWCLGLFDRAFEPERPVTGSLRTRSTAEHARRLDLDKFEGRATRRIRRESVLVIGAGIAGSHAARILHDQGHPVTVLDKGRGPGGRSSSRRGDGVRHDHGCQVLRLRGEHLERLATSWEEDGVIARWNPRVLQAGSVLPRPREPWFVGIPGMNQLVRHLQSDLEVDFKARVTGLKKTSTGWAAFDETDSLLGEGDRLIVASPAPQAAVLLRSAGLDAGPLDAVRFDPTWTLMLDGIDHDPGFDVAIDPVPGIRWMAREASRPGREDSGGWTVSATPDWSRANLESDADLVESHLRELAFEALGTTVPGRGKAHRWRYALVDQPLGRPVHLDEPTGAIACGDWCLGARIEQAFESGAAAAGRLLRDPNFAGSDSPTDPQADLFADTAR